MNCTYGWTPKNWLRYFDANRLGDNKWRKVNAKLLKMAACLCLNREFIILDVSCFYSSTQYTCIHLLKNYLNDLLCWDFTAKQNTWRLRPFFWGMFQNEGVLVENIVFPTGTGFCFAYWFSLQLLPWSFLMIYEFWFLINCCSSFVTKGSNKIELVSRSQSQMWYTHCETTSYPSTKAVALSFTG